MQWILHHRDLPVKVEHKYQKSQKKCYLIYWPYNKMIHDLPSICSNETAIYFTLFKCPSTTHKMFNFYHPFVVQMYSLMDMQWILHRDLPLKIRESEEVLLDIRAYYNKIEGLPLI